MLVHIAEKMYLCLYYADEGKIVPIVQVSATTNKASKIERMCVMAGQTTNRLIEEKSPYLRQHAHNPVNWYPWGEEAFLEAKRRDVPILLSVGYSTCHWCHVMERESFADETVATALNAAFVCIKVDREERPDIDSVYMNVCQALTGTGGWPLTIIMTPDKHPLFAATYLPPPRSRYGRPGLLELSAAISEAWQHRRQELIERAGNAGANGTNKGTEWAVEHGYPAQGLCLFHPNL